jgi:hypothetical protein
VIGLSVEGLSGITSACELQFIPLVTNSRNLLEGSLLHSKRRGAVESAFRRPPSTGRDYSHLSDRVSMCAPFTNQRSAELDSEYMGCVLELDTKLEKTPLDIQACLLAGKESSAEFIQGAE